MDYFDLGTLTRPVSTHSPKAQCWFDRGLVWSYAFNHEEAVTCFESAAAADPDCAMAYWGVAYALGPNYNKPWEFFDDVELRHTVERTHAAVEQAHALREGTIPIERALIEALRERYPPRAPWRTVPSGTSPMPRPCVPCTNSRPTTSTSPRSTRTR